MSAIEIVAVALLFRGFVSLLHRIVVWVALELLWLYHWLCLFCLLIWHQLVEIAHLLHP